MVIQKMHVIGNIANSQQPQVDILSLESQKSFGDELAPNRGG